MSLSSACGVSAIAPIVTICTTATPSNIPSGLPKRSAPSLSFHGRQPAWANSRRRGAIWPDGWCPRPNAGCDNDRHCRVGTFENFEKGQPVHAGPPVDVGYDNVELAALGQLQSFFGCRRSDCVDARPLSQDEPDKGTNTAEIVNDEDQRARADSTWVFETTGNVCGKSLGDDMIWRSFDSRYDQRMVSIRGHFCNDFHLTSDPYLGAASEGVVSLWLK